MRRIQHKAVHCSASRLDGLSQGIGETPARGTLQTDWVPRRDNEPAWKVDQVAPSTIADGLHDASNLGHSIVWHFHTVATSQRINSLRRAVPHEDSTVSCKAWVAAAVVHAHIHRCGSAWRSSVGTTTIGNCRARAWLRRGEFAEKIIGLIA
jgi:hypothetical protein